MRNYPVLVFVCCFYTKQTGPISTPNSWSGAPISMGATSVMGSLDVFELLYSMTVLPHCPVCCCGRKNGPLGECFSVVTKQGSVCPQFRGLGHVLMPLKYPCYIFNEWLINYWCIRYYLIISPGGFYETLSIEKGALNVDLQASLVTFFCNSLLLFPFSYFLLHIFFFFTNCFYRTWCNLVAFQTFLHRAGVG